MTDHIPPSNLEAEQAVLGAVMVEPDLFALVSSIIEPTDFCAPHHATIFRAMSEQHERKEPLDKVGIAEAIGRAQLANIGGPAYLSQLINTVPDSATAEYYAGIVSEKAALRRLLQVAAGLEADANVAGALPADVCNSAFESLRKIIVRSARERANALFEALGIADKQENAASKSGPGIAYPITQLQRISATAERPNERGMKPGQITIVGARSGVGKSSLLESIGARAAVDNRVLFFPLEMGLRETLARMQERASYSLLAATIGTDNFRIVDNTQSIGVEQIAGLCALHRPDLVLIDHARHIRGWFEGRKGEGRDMAPTRIMHRLSDISKAFSCHIVLAQQINRDTSGNQPPTMTQLRDSGALEELAHRVILMHRPHIDDAPKDTEIVLHLAKNRSGPSGHITCNWVGSTRSILDMRETNSEPKLFAPQAAS